MALDVRITGIVLAAGMASRMGQVKQLLPFRGKTILDVVLRNAVASRLHSTILVLGHAAALIEQKVGLEGVTTVINRQYRDGQSTSLQAGLAAVSKDTDAAMFLLGDQPLVTTALIDRIIDAYEQSRSPLTIPFFDGKRGNPVIVDRCLFDEIKQLSGDSGARTLFRSHADQIRKVPIADSAIHFDIDTWQDYRRLELYLKGL